MTAGNDAAEALKALGPPRLWSMLVTIFGDLARAPQDRIDGPVLTRLTAGMDLKPQAVRVALHRLRNDGWITSEKHGRTASYALTESGRAQSQTASHRIYAPPAQEDIGWQLVVTEVSDADVRQQMEAAGFAQLMPRVFCGSAAMQVPEHAMVFDGGAAPAWLRNQIVPQDLTAAYAQLHDALEQVAASLRGRAPDTMVERAILRCLIVHHWRRLMLRHPDLPQSLMGADWPGHLCRARVTDLLALLPRPPLNALAD